MKTGICSYSEFKIYPSKGIKFVRLDSKVLHFINTKVESLSNRKINPRDIRWTNVYRRINKSTGDAVAAKKKSRRTKKVEKSIVGASLEVINQKRNLKPEVKAAQRETHLREIKEKKKAAAGKKEQQKTAKPSAKTAKGK
ncbi:S60 ribosomal protein L24 [Tieghemostelium lacteum]|uniref:S60 ribosomal protein L24 n=1 Tax=Tieghemostelium lacteum TaxID=361077 RepID=A0A151ZK73_TIELA|nr:S60 ribosomal protein L24 [Tieghemostelium lacteum]|eukprot:KYQ94346.1 S60 ribosomal protein L24 [Tieghemostelium lacteum]